MKRIKRAAKRNFYKLIMGGSIGYIGLRLTWEMYNAVDFLPNKEWPRLCLYLILVTVYGYGGCQFLMSLKNLAVIAIDFVLLILRRIKMRWRRR